MENEKMTKKQGPSVFKKGWNYCKNNLHLVVPFILLAFVIILFFVVAAIKELPISNNLKSILTNTIPYIIAAFGTVYVTALGGTDITQGSLLAFFIACSAQVYNSTQNVFLSLIVGLATGAASGLVMGFVNAKCKVSSFMTSLGVLMFLRAVATIIGGGSQSIKVPSYMSVFSQLYVSIPAVIVLFIITYYIFHKTPYGTYVRAIGENENAVIYAGVNVKRVKMFAFFFSGLLTAIAGFFYFGRYTVTVASTSGIGFEMSILIAMFLGGIPVEGGYGTKVYMIVLGAFTIAFIERIFVLFDLNTDVSQLVKGFVLIGILLLTSYLKRRKITKENSASTKASKKEAAKAAN